MYPLFQSNAKFNNFKFSDIYPSNKFPVKIEGETKEVKLAFGQQYSKVIGFDEMRFIGKAKTTVTADMRYPSVAPTRPSFQFDVTFVLF
jgi:hypothetical protein